MKFLFASDHEYLPDRVGGRENSIHDLACALIDRGHHVRVVARARKPGNIPPSDGRNWHAPYRVDRVDDVIALAEVLLRENQVDLAIYGLHNLPQKLAKGSDIAHRQIAYVRDAREIRDWSARTFRPLQTIIANSDFIANEIRKSTGLEPLVIPPIINAENYRVSSNRRFVTFINPVAVKGVDLALAIARSCPEIPFLFVEGWPLTEPQLDSLRDSLKPLKNVTFVRRHLDARDIYVDTGVLLVPSQWEEAFGRVVIEAQLSGIPVLASAVGGLSETTGKGGILIAPDAPASEWVKALRLLWPNEDTWNNLSRRAIENAERHMTRTASAPEQIINLAEQMQEKLHTSALVPRTTDTQCSFILYANSPEGVEETLRSLQWQTHGSFDCIVLAGPDTDPHQLVPGAIREDERVRVIAAKRNCSIVDATYDALKSLTGIFVSILQPGEVLEETFLEMLLRAHHNPQQMAALTACDIGIYHPCLGIIAPASTGFRNGALGNETHNVNEARLAEASYSIYNPPWTFRPAWLPGPGLLIRRDAVELIAPTDGHFAEAADFREYLAVGAHVIGGSLFVDRTLCWTPTPSDPSRRQPLISQYQRRHEDHWPALKEEAVRFFLANGGADYLSSNDAVRIFSAHFRPSDVFRWSTTDHFLKSLLLEASLGEEGT